MPLVMLKGNWPGGKFNRGVRDAKGVLLKMLEFRSGEPVNLVGDELLAVAGDIGHALVAVTVNSKTGKTTVLDSTDLDIVAAANAPAVEEDEIDGEAPMAQEPEVAAPDPEPVASPEKTDGPQAGRQDRRRR